MIAVAMATHLTLAGPVHVEPEPIKKSRFIGDGAPAHSAEEAMAFVDEIRDRYSDAGHHCFAWRLKAGDQGFRTSDDGEPGGTGGPPILNHIDGAALVGVVFVVTRYFGGIKLGKGGLIRAYGGTAGEAIRSAEIIEVRETIPVHIHTSYPDQGTIEGVLRGFALSPSTAEYGAGVHLTVDVPIEEEDALRSMLTEATGGRVDLSAGR
jgi:uncharacterized YigZ family protein